MLPQATGQLLITPSPLYWWGILIIVLLFGLQLRLETVAYSRVVEPLRGDAGDYTAYAFNISKFGIYSRDKTAAFGGKTAPEPDAVRSD